MKEPSVVIWSLLFGAIGLGYFAYGARQRVIVPFVVGVALLIFPYFVTNLYLLIVVGFALVAVPYFMRA